MISEMHYVMWTFTSSIICGTTFFSADLFISHYFLAMNDSAFVYIFYVPM